MGAMTSEEAVRRYTEASVQADLDALEALRAPDWTCDWPQSGERVPSSAAYRRIVEHYPGGAPRSKLTRLVGPEDQWVVTPSNTLVRMTGSGDFWWVEWVVTYPDGHDYQVVSLIQLRDGLVHREIAYWAEPFAAPDWRAQWVDHPA
jgi:hypothetical protein